MRKLSARLCVSRLYGSFGAVKTKTGLLGLDEEADRKVARRHKLLHNSRRFDTAGVMDEHVI